MKFYINGPTNKGEGVYTLIHHDGEVLASHFCSSYGFAPSDLILGRPERKTKWTEELGPLDPIELVWLGDVPEAERAELARKNHEKHEAYLASLPPCNGNCDPDDKEGIRVVDSSCPRHGREVADRD